MPSLYHMFDCQILIVLYEYIKY